MLYTEDESPWVKYLEIDEETLESRIRDDVPDDVRKAYETYLKESKDMGVITC